MHCIVSPGHQIADVLAMLLGEHEMSLFELQALCNRIFRVSLEDRSFAGSNQQRVGKLGTQSRFKNDTAT
jgi:hypothetical protein